MRGVESKPQVKLVGLEDSSRPITREWHAGKRGNQSCQLLSFNQLKTPCDPIPSFLTLKADSDPRFVISDPKLL